MLHYRPERREELLLAASRHHNRQGLLLVAQTVYVARLRCRRRLLELCERAVVPDTLGGNSSQSYDAIQRLGVAGETQVPESVDKGADGKH